MASAFSLIVNAGGHSRRMGQHKALLRVPGGMTLLHRTIEQLAPLATESIIVVSNHRAINEVAQTLPGVHCVPDDYPDGGPLGGIASGLAQVSGWAILVACDMPLMQPQVFCALCALATMESTQPPWAVVPLIEGQPQPFHALYNRECLSVIEVLLAQGERRASSFLSLVPTRWVTAAELQAIDPELRSLINVNTPQEWQAAYARLAAE